MFGIVVHRVRCTDEYARGSTVFPGVWISIEAWEVAAADFNPQTMALSENVAGRPYINCEFVDLPRVHQRWFFLRFSKARADDPFGQILGDSVRPNVDELGRDLLGNVRARAAKFSASALLRCRPDHVALFVHDA